MRLPRRWGQVSTCFSCLRANKRLTAHRRQGATTACRSCWQALEQQGRALPALAAVHGAHTPTPSPDSYRPQILRAMQLHRGSAFEAHRHHMYSPGKRLEQFLRSNMGYNPPPHELEPGAGQFSAPSRHAAVVSPSAPLRPPPSWLRLFGGKTGHPNAADTCLSPLDEAGPLLPAHFFEVAQTLCITFPNLVQNAGAESHAWQESGRPCDRDWHSRNGKSTPAVRIFSL